MGLLLAIPNWAYFLVLLVTYVVVHVLAFDPRRLLKGRLAFWGRMASAILLLLALVTFRREEPTSLLLALALSTTGGFLSGRSTLPPKPRGSDGPGADRG